jgi:hypothetical protein
VHDYEQSAKLLLDPVDVIILSSVSMLKSIAAEKAHLHAAPKFSCKQISFGVR